jgi:hypothetical protein
MSDGLTPEFSWRKAIWKGLKTAGLVIAAMWTALYPLLEERFADEGTVAALLPPKYVHFAGVIAGAIRVYSNHRKQTKD